MTNDQIAQHLTPQDTAHISRDFVRQCIMDALWVKDHHYVCHCNEPTGWTTVKCCNICGYPIPSENWHRSK